LTNRQPIVVSYTALLREKADSALGIAKGARLMLSTPPAIISEASPDLMVRAALLEAVEAERLDADQHLAGLRHRNSPVLDPQRFGAAGRVQDGRLHRRGKGHELVLPTNAHERI
jgi:hypothetical protein